MNQYALTGQGNLILNDRTRIMANPIIKGFTENLNYSDYLLSNNEELKSYLSNPISTIDVRMTQSLGKLIFVFDLQEVNFTVNYQSFILGFRNDLSQVLTEDTDTRDWENLIYINCENCFAGITEQNIGDEDIVVKRMPVSQFRYGTNSLIIENKFNCKFINDFELPKNLGTELLGVKKQLSEFNYMFKYLM